jgi:drug/metabolite transporter (DMT)-like permease
MATFLSIRFFKLRAIINSTTPFFTVLGAYFILNEYLNKEKIIGIIIGFLGVLIIFFPSLFDNVNNTNENFAALLVLCASLSYAAAFIYIKKFLMHIPPIIAALSQLLGALVFVIPLALYYEQPLTMIMPSYKAIIGISGLTLLSTTLAFIIYFNLNKNAGPTYASMSTLLFPIIAIILGALILKEKLNLYNIIGALIVIIGLAIAHNLIKFNSKRIYEQ